jgi:hypothetical protein
VPGYRLPIGLIVLSVVAAAFRINTHANSAFFPALHVGRRAEPGQRPRKKRKAKLGTGTAKSVVAGAPIALSGIVFCQIILGGR